MESTGPHTTGGCCPERQQQQQEQEEEEQCVEHQQADDTLPPHLVAMKLWLDQLFAQEPTQEAAGATGDSQLHGAGQDNATASPPSTDPGETLQHTVTADHVTSSSQQQQQQADCKPPGTQPQQVMGLQLQSLEQFVDTLAQHTAGTSGCTDDTVNSQQQQQQTDNTHSSTLARHQATLQSVEQWVRQHQEPTAGTPGHTGDIVSNPQQQETDYTDFSTLPRRAFYQSAEQWVRQHQEVTAGT